ncbi:PREDICTED: glycine, alanine and asparagine-rich protein-like [Wasmannia auropunctata]|uniref:glycine, alanine and asparagine-rich protein-like n=1 Tax=Wasmannia auropunctata TaxID=64793 RepID=UPI0005EF768D|nr:PREDICTED: glycine, alanine and asparagine-rich protein-like [Wasmannia auropunctata]
MRILFTVLLCLTLAACINADYQNNCTIGKREEDDFMFIDKTVSKPAIPLVASRHVISLKAPKRTILTDIQIIILRNKQAKCIVKHHRETSVLIILEGKPGEGLAYNVKGYAKYILTTLAQTSTSKGSEESNSENDNTPNAGDGNNNSGEGGDEGKSAPDAGNGGNNSGEGGDGKNSVPDVGNGDNNLGEGGDEGNSAPNAGVGDNN